MLLPRDGAMITQRAEAASAAGAKALVLYGDGGVPGRRARPRRPRHAPDHRDSGRAGRGWRPARCSRAARSRSRSARRRARINPETGSIAAFSSTGLAFDDSVKPDLVAPGVAITSSSPGGSYMAHSGTSVAAAQVAGAASLVRQAHPTWSPRRRARSARRHGLAGAAARATGPRPSRPRAAVPSTWRPRATATVVAEPASLTFGLARAPRGQREARAHAREHAAPRRCTSPSRSCATAAATTARRSRSAVRPRSSRSRPARRCPCRSR